MQRYVVARRRRAAVDARLAGPASFDRVREHFQGAVASLLPGRVRAGGSSHLVIESSSAALADAYARLADEVKQDIIVEPEIFRFPVPSGSAFVQAMVASQGPEPMSAGVGAMFTVRLRGGEQPLDGARATLFLAHLAGVGTGTRVEATSDHEGVVRIPYNASTWQTTLLTIEPQSGFWSWLQPAPKIDDTLDLPALPRSGPLGWWHQLVGIQRFSLEAGKGIKIGVIDTGTGPHPYLSHVKRLGAVAQGTYDPSDTAGFDVAGHGTHVAGILGARPVDGSGEFGGLAPGADILAVRVFPKDGGANQVDIGDAIEILVKAGVDLINMSFGSEYPSEIELDAIQYAAEAGVVCIAAAGNSYGQPIMYPAAYPPVAAVSALGVVGANPSGTIASYTQPSRQDQFAGPLYVANFNNVGPSLLCSAPGCGIVSTVPVRGIVPTPYVDMSGSSMAAPVACGALATLLGQDPSYLEMPRGVGRAQRASSLLTSLLFPLRLSPQFAGRGMSRGWSG